MYNNNNNNKSRRRKYNDCFLLCFLSTFLFFFMLQFLPFYSSSLAFCLFYLNHDFFVPFSVMLAPSPFQDVIVQRWKCQLYHHRSSIGSMPAFQVPSFSYICMYGVRSESSTWFNVHIEAKRSKLDRVYVNDRSVT